MGEAHNIIMNVNIITLWLASQECIPTWQSVRPGITVPNYPMPTLRNAPRHNYYTKLRNGPKLRMYGSISRTWFCYHVNGTLFAKATQSATRSSSI